jgi:hypothetical protein
MRLGFDSRRAHFSRRLYSGIITDCGSVDPGSIPGLRIQKDVVAEWLTRLTANQFLSGAQVRVLPTSFSFFGRCGAKAACETSDLLIGVQFPAPSLAVLRLSRPSGSGVRIPPSVLFCAEVTKRSNVRDSRTIFLLGAGRGSIPDSPERNLGVAGSTPALGFMARLAQSVEHKTLMLLVGNWQSWGRGFDPRVGLDGPTSSVGRAQDSYWFPFF